MNKSKHVSSINIFTRIFQIDSVIDDLVGKYSSVLQIFLYQINVDTNNFLRFKYYSSTKHALTVCLDILQRMQFQHRSAMNCTFHELDEKVLPQFDNDKCLSWKWRMLTNSIRVKILITIWTTVYSVISDVLTAILKFIFSFLAVFLVVAYS